MEGPLKKAKASPAAPMYAHLDVNCYYASVEEALDPSLVGKPVGVRQRNLVVTANYTSRSRGVPKMCSVEEAYRICPEIVLIESDMSRYRAMHLRLFALLRSAPFNLQPEKLSIDEALLDISSLLERAEPLWDHEELCVFGGKEKFSSSAADDIDAMMMIAKGARVALDIRESIRAGLRLECSMGVSFNRAFAKYAAGLNKPSRMTIVPKSAHPVLLNSIHPSTISGIGPALLKRLEEICSTRLDCFAPACLADLQRLEPQELEVFGVAGKWLFSLCRGEDLRPVKDKGPPGTIGLQAAHRFRCNSLQEVYGVILSKAEELELRLREDEELYSRIARTLNVGFQFRGKSCNKSVAMPARGGENRCLDIAAAAMSVLSEHAAQDPDVISSQRFGLSATNFSEEGSGLAEVSISKFVSVGMAPNWDAVPDQPAAAALKGIETFLKKGLVPPLPAPPPPPAPPKRGSILSFLDDSASSDSPNVCPFCKVVVKGNLNVHANSHFDKTASDDSSSIAKYFQKRRQ